MLRANSLLRPLSALCLIVYIPRSLYFGNGAEGDAGRQLPCGCKHAAEANRLVTEALLDVVEGM